MGPLGTPAASCASRRARRSASASRVKSVSGRASLVSAISSTRRGSDALRISSAASSSTVSARARRSAPSNRRASSTSAATSSGVPSNSSVLGPAIAAVYTSRTCATRSCVSSIKSLPSSACTRTRPNSPTVSRTAILQANSESTVEATSPSSERASSTRTEPSPNTESCSSVESASRMPPRAWRATISSASSSKAKPSCSQMNRRRPTMSSFEMRWKSKRWQRDRIVSRIFCGSVVHSTKTT